jgi:CSLREA domain-containing protein
VPSNDILFYNEEKSEKDNFMKKQSPRIAFGALIMAMMLLIISPLQSARASTFIVDTLTDDSDGSCSDGDCSLRDAIFSAGPSGDVITFGVTGVIPLTFGQITIDKDITINGPGAGLLTISGESTSRVFFINNTTSVVSITGLTIANGRVIDADGGGILNNGTLTLDKVIINSNNAVKNSSVFTDGGGIYNQNTLTITNSEITNNQANLTGGGIANSTTASSINLSLSNVTISGNDVVGDVVGGLGGAISILGDDSSSVTMDSVRIVGNGGKNAGGLYITNLSTFEMSNSLITSNFAPDGVGGAWFSSANGTYNISNSTISNNEQTTSTAGLGGGLFMEGGHTANLSHVTMTGNSMAGITGSGGITTSGTVVVNLQNSIIAGNLSANSSDDDCSATINSLDYNLIQDADGNCIITGTTTHNITGQDPLLNALADNGGLTKTHSLQPGSPALDAIPNGTGGCGTTFTVDQSGVTRPQDGNGDLTFACDIGAREEAPQIDIIIGGANQGTFAVNPGFSTRQSFAGVNNGPVQLDGNSTDIIASERVIYSINGVGTSFSETMALPGDQLDTSYWLPWYNNVDLDTQLRFGNVSGSTATVQVFIGGTEMIGSPFILTTGQSTRVSFPGVNNGPVQIVSDQPIVAAERVIYNVNGTGTSFSEMMALPDDHLDTSYWLPWYNNVDLDTQLRFGNVSGSTATVHVYIGGTEMTGSPFILTAGQSTRVSFPGVNNGPVQIVSDQPVVAAERVIYNVNGTGTSFSEMMALPDDHLNTSYWLPWYNNVDLDTQLRFGNVSGSTATVHVYIGGTEMTGSPFILTTGQSTRVSFPGVNNGPVQIVSDQQIVAAERVIYTVNGVATSFSEMMGLPDSLLDTSYWTPWYNNVDLDTQLRFGVP